MTGQAAALLGSFASTLHSLLGVGWAEVGVERLVWRVRNSKSERTKAFWAARNPILIIDEVSMLHAREFDKFEALARIVRKSDDHFGGIQLVLFGDPFQLAPVDRELGPTDPSSLFYNAKTWDLCIGDRKFELKDNMRQCHDPAYFQFLSRIRVGDIDDAMCEELESMSQPLPVHFGIVASHLACKRTEVDAINQKELSNLAGEASVFDLEESHLEECEKELESLRADCPVFTGLDEARGNVPKALHIKVGAQVIFVVNSATNPSIRNGTRGIVTSIRYGIPYVRIESGTIEPAHRFTWTRTDRKDHTRVLASITQIPLLLAWACTIHRMQGATLTSAVIDIGSLFALGHLYAAMSRVRSRNGVQLIRFQRKKLIKPPDSILKFVKTVRPASSLRQIDEDDIHRQPRRRQRPSPAEFSHNGNAHNRTKPSAVSAPVAPPAATSCKLEQLPPLESIAGRFLHLAKVKRESQVESSAIIAGSTVSVAAAAPIARPMQHKRKPESDLVHPDTKRTVPAKPVTTAPSPLQQPLIRPIVQPTLSRASLTIEPSDSRKLLRQSDIALFFQ